MTTTVLEGGDLPRERRRRILELLGRDGKVLAPDLSGRFGVSEDTVRRDLRAMAKEGLLLRVHGGALPVSPSTPPYTVREERGVPGLRRIARAAAKLLGDGEVFYIDSGVTALEVARSLSPDARGTAVTAAPLAAAELAGRPGLEVVVVGGRLDKETMAASGAAALAGIEALRLDALALGVCGLHPDAGVTATDYDEAHLKRALIERAAEVIVPAAPNKIGTVAPHAAAPLGAVTRLITGKQVPEETLAPYRKAGLDVDTV